ncbi:hypothetical protein QYF36_007906 [Acer negundo]|nr:hypothetical protein QYF36_007906 [Acer negundo]
MVFVMNDDSGLDLGVMVMMKLICGFFFIFDFEASSSVDLQSLVGLHSLSALKSCLGSEFSRIQPHPVGFGGL